jgi:hypothetical protein
MVEGIVLDIYCAEVDEVYADVIPGKTITTRISPNTRLIVRDLENRYDNLMGIRLLSTHYKFTNPFRFDDITCWLHKYLLHPHLLKKIV